MEPIILVLVVILICLQQSADNATNRELRTVSRELTRLQREATFMLRSLRGLDAAVTLRLDTTEAFEHIRQATTDESLRKVAIEAALLAKDGTLKEVTHRIRHEPLPSTRNKHKRLPRRR